VNERTERLALLKTWLAMPMDLAVKQAIERVQRAEDVVHVAVMPDVHLAGDVCVGTAMATSRLVYPSAVGGDIGCGMLAMAFDASADVLRDAKNAGAVLRMLGERIPSQRRNRTRTLPWPDALQAKDLSHPSLQALVNSDGRLQFGTLGSGNHFVELQADEDDRLWLMIHSGSRAMGQAIKEHHVANSTIKSSGLPVLDSDAPEGQAYLHDQEWARRFALANRQAMAEQVLEILRSLFEIEPVESTIITCDHNHVCREEHFGQSLLIHRKGAMPAQSGSLGVVPGSMGTISYHVEGRGCAEALFSSAHGAGRVLARGRARQRFSRADLCMQMQGVWFDPRLCELLREEAPESYKDVHAVMRAQRELVKVIRSLRPLLVHKGR
jgi:tRNA-splicing ligase RtcB (3'-phosphate/5'-hydroxy nucleic acid ligase)